MPAITFECPNCGHQHRRDRIPILCAGVEPPPPRQRPQLPLCPACGKHHAPSEVPALCRRQIRHAQGLPPPFTARKKIETACYAGDERLAEFPSLASLYAAICGWIPCTEAHRRAVCGLSQSASAFFVACERFAAGEISAEARAAKKSEMLAVARRLRERAAADGAIWQQAQPDWLDRMTSVSRLPPPLPTNVLVGGEVVAE